LVCHFGSTRCGIHCFRASPDFGGNSGYPTGLGPQASSVGRFYIVFSSTLTGAFFRGGGRQIDRLGTTTTEIIWHAGISVMLHSRQSYYHCTLDYTNLLTSYTESVATDLTPSSVVECPETMIRRTDV